MVRALQHLGVRDAVERHEKPAAPPNRLVLGAPEGEPTGAVSVSALAEELSSLVRLELPEDAFHCHVDLSIQRRFTRGVHCSPPEFFVSRPLDDLAAGGNLHARFVTCVGSKRATAAAPRRPCGRCRAGSANQRA